MSDLVLVIICGAILLVALIILCYAAHLVNGEYRVIKTRIGQLESLLARYEELRRADSITISSTFNREQELINNVNKVLELNDQIIKDNHKLSNELGLMSLEIRGRRLEVEHDAVGITPVNGTN